MIQQALDIIRTSAQYKVAHINPDVCAQVRILARKEGDTLVVELHDAYIIDPNVVERIGDEFLQFAVSFQQILVDFSRVKYCSSAIIDKLFEMQKVLRASSGELRICGMPVPLSDVFDIADLDSVFDCGWPNQETALQDFATPQKKQLR